MGDNFAFKGTLATMYSTVILLLIAFVIGAPLTDVLTEKGTLTASTATSLTLESGRVGWYAAPVTGTTYSAPKGMQLPTGCTVDSAAWKAYNDGGRVGPITAASCTANATGSYITEDNNEYLSIFLVFAKIFPFMLLIGGIGTGAGAAAYGARSGLGGGLGGGLWGAGLNFLVGIVLLPIIIVFVVQTGDQYTVQPEYIAITALLPLILVSYGLGLLGTTFGSAAPTFRGYLKGGRGGMRRMRRRRR